MIETTRRTLITGLISLVAAPAICRASSLMPVRSIEPEPFWIETDFYRYYVQEMPRPTGVVRILRSERKRDGRSTLMQYGSGRMINTFAGAPPNVLRDYSPIEPPWMPEPPPRPTLLKA